MKTKLLIMSLLCLVLIQGCKSKDKNEVISADGVKISYDVYGIGEPAIVFVHGWNCNRSFWKYQVPHFEKKHKVVTLDLGGHGQSSLGRENWTIEAFGKDVVAVIKKLKLEKVILVGHSMGGPVIMETARLMPDKVITIVGADTFHDINKGYDSVDIKKIVDSMKIDFPTTIKAFLSQMFPVDVNDILVEWTLNKVLKANPHVAINIFENLPSYNMKKAATDINVPVYSINSDIWPTDSETNNKYLEKFEVKIMPGLGHFVMLEDPNQFNSHLDEIIDEI